MGFLQLVLESRNKTKTAPTTMPTIILDLPGFKRRERLVADAITRTKKLYNECVIRLRAETKSLSSARGERKKEVQWTIEQLKFDMEGCLERIGSYTRDEQLNGFDEVNHEF